MPRSSGCAARSWRSTKRTTRWRGRRWSARSVIRAWRKASSSRWKTKSDLLIAQHRRSRAMGKAVDAGTAMGNDSAAAAFDRMKSKVRHSEAAAQAKSDLAADNVEDRFAALEKQDEINRLLEEIKSKRKAG